MSWSCPECDHLNAGTAALCDRCGVALRHLEDPPVDIPYTPKLADLPSFFLLQLWLLLTLAGGLLLAVPGLSTRLGIPLGFVAFEVIGAALASFSAVRTVFWQRRLNQLTVDGPDRVRSGEPFKVSVAIVPYRNLDNVNLEIALVDRFYHRSREGRLETRSKRLGRLQLLAGSDLRGRRVNAFTTTFVAPFPATRHEDLGAELAASLIGLFGWMVPGAAEVARNLKQHGGYYLRVRLRVGPFTKTLERRVISYYLGHDLFIG